MGKKHKDDTAPSPDTDAATTGAKASGGKAPKKAEKKADKTAKKADATTAKKVDTKVGKAVKKTGTKTADEAEKKTGKKAQEKAHEKALDTADEKARKKADEKAEKKARKKAEKAERKRLEELVEAARPVAGAPESVDEALEEVGASAGTAATVVEVADLVASTFVDALKVGPDFRLSEVDSSSTPGFTGGREEAEALMAAAEPEIAELQERLYADSRDGDGASVLLVVQGLDTAGKGGIMRHVVGLLDPQGTTIHAFKKPTPEERRHPFLWRIRRALPEPGIIGVFDRSHYEDVLVARVDDLVPTSTWRRRYGQIRTFENSLVAGGTTVIKVMLHIGHEEQGARLAERLERPDKYWKFNPGDIDTRRKWDAYAEAYQEALVKTSTDEAPWYVVPADHKWYARLAVQQLLLDALRRIDPQWPAATFDVEEQKARLADS